MPFQRRITGGEEGPGADDPTAHPSFVFNKKTPNSELLEGSVS
jgi:hypothetical protein